MILVPAWQFVLGTVCIIFCTSAALFGVFVLGDLISEYMAELRAAQFEPEPTQKPTGLGWPE